MQMNDLRASAGYGCGGAGHIATRARIDSHSLLRRGAVDRIPDCTGNLNIGRIGLYLNANVLRTNPHSSNFTSEQNIEFKRGRIDAIAQREG